ncbi:MAG: hypothetical protein IK083_01410 [Abditibacteriota bacterium]|nr:hypothetical protein [Abditibacteriota bacterium]
MADEFDSNVVSTNESTDKKCPQCGGVMDYDPSSGGMKCPYCDYKEDIAAPDNDGDHKPKRAEEQDFDDAEHTANCDWGVATKTVVCKSCGGEMIYDAMQIAGECPYCGSNQIMEASDQTSIAPGGIVPFKLDQKTADENFRKWIGSLLFCPNACKSGAHARQFKGIYLPYWTFDTQTDSDYTAEYGEEEQDKDGNKETTWHKTRGTFQMDIDDELVIGTNKYDAGILSGIEPFNTENNVAYEPKYISGFACERYSVGIKDAWQKAKTTIKEKIRNGITEKIRRKYSTNQVRNLNIETEYSHITYKYLLLPVWMSSFKYEGKIYQFTVNGQTGKVSGKAPVSPWKVALAIVIGLIIIGVIYYFTHK